MVLQHGIGQVTCADDDAGVMCETVMHGRIAEMR